MKRKVAKLRLSPNEEAQLIREEYERRRKLRVQQVREQERHIALQIRQDVQRRQEQELQNLAEQLREDWQHQQKEKIETLQRVYQESLQLIGEGHRSAKENEPDWEAIAQREEDNRIKAEDRYQEALKELKLQRQKDNEEQKRAIKARKKALQAEKERSSKVASLPPPPLNPIENIEPRKPHTVRKTDLTAFSATHYHMLMTAVDREVDTVQPNAYEEAELEAERLQVLEKHAKREREEQGEKACLRGKYALMREQLIQDQERFIVQLEHMQQTDLLRRRQQVSQMPAQIFQPLYKRQNIREDNQREMEFAFEGMYTGERRVKGNLVLQLVPEPLPALSTGSQNQELDVTMEDVTMEDVTTPLKITPGPDEHHDNRQQGDSSEPASTQEPPRQALKKLLNRIRSQRDQWNSQGGPVPASIPPATVTVHAAEPTPEYTAELDTTIDTGSLNSEEKERPSSLSPEHPESPPALEESIVAGTLPDVLANKIHRFEEERKKREEELEKEKQQQITLLKDLEEQKGRLEQMRLEAQQERENLQTAVDEEIPAHDQAVTCDTPGLAPEEVLTPNDHTRRIREYQQRLLEQNRLHKSSVEVARQALEEYQRALRIRYNMAPTSVLPTDVPPDLIRPPQPSAESTTQQIPTGSAGLAYITGPHAKTKTALQIPTNVETSLSGHVVDQRRSLSIDSLPVHLKSSVGSARHLNSVTTRLTNNIMERVTEHLPQKLKPSLVITHPQSRRQFTAHPQPSIASYPPPPSSGPLTAVQGLCLVSANGPPSALGQVSVEAGPFLQRLPTSGPLAQKQVMTHKASEEERQRPSFVTTKCQYLRSFTSNPSTCSYPLPFTTDPIQTISPVRTELPEQASVKPGVLNFPHRFPLLGPLASWEDDMERRRQELEEAHRQVLEHKVQQQKEYSKEEQRQKLEEDKEQLKKQREALQALISVDTQPSPESAEVSVSENFDETRGRLLSSLLRAIEESNEGTLEHLEDDQEQENALGPQASTSYLSCQSSVADRPAPPPHPQLDPYFPARAPKPPITRVKLGLTDIAGLHELSTIQEVETPLDTDLVEGLAPRCLSTSSLDSGRGATNFPGQRICYKSPTDTPPRPDSMSSTISTGSYTTSDPEQSSSHTETSMPRDRLYGVRGIGVGMLLATSPLSSQSSHIEEQVAQVAPCLAVDSPFHDNSIQRIIDKYTRELNISLNTAGNTTEGRDSCVEGSNYSAIQQPGVGIPEGTPCSQSPPSVKESGGMRGGLEWDNTLKQILECVNGQHSSLAQNQGKDSFRPLIGQLADQSACLAAEQRDVAELIGQPSAHSSMIGQLLVQPALSGVDQGAWDSTLSGGQEFNTSQRAQMELDQSSSWLDQGHEGQMRPLKVELDESATQRSGWLGTEGEQNSVALAVSGQPAAVSDPVSAPEAHYSPDPGLNRQDESQQTFSPQQDPERSEAADSFHPLMAEVTHSEMIDPSMTFHLPEQEVPSSPEKSGQTPKRGCNHKDSSMESDHSPEYLRADELSCWLPAATHTQETSSQLITSQCHPLDSVLVVSPTVPEVELTALGLSGLKLCDAFPSTPNLKLRNDGVWNKMMEAASEKGILEESEITLVSLTDTTLQDPDSTITEDVEKDETEMVLPEGTCTIVKAENKGPHAVMLEFQWSPSQSKEEAFQQKRTALLHRSYLRVEEIKANRGLANAQPQVQGQTEAQKVKDARHITCKTKTSSHKRHVTKEETAKDNISYLFSSRKKSQLAAPVSDPMLKLVDEMIFTPDQRKQDVSEMHQRTQRLYEQLEEVKHQREMRSRQEACAKNRLKAKEFHKKTLQKLRAKQVHRR